MTTPRETPRLFHLGDILSITTGYLVSPRKMDGVYDILNYMTGESLFTHALVRASKTCEPALLAQHPQLRDITVPEDRTGEWWGPWLYEQIQHFGETLPVKPLAEYEHMDPFTELGRMGFGGEVIPIVVEEQPDAD